MRPTNTANWIRLELFLMLIGVSAFAAPEQGQAHLDGIEEVAQVDPDLADDAQTATTFSGHPAPLDG